MQAMAFRVLLAYLPWILIGLAASHGAVFFYGRHWQADVEEARVERERARLQRELFTVADDMSERSAALEAEISALSARAQEHENEARADADDCRLPDPDSLRRLSRRWAAD